MKFFARIPYLVAVALLGAMLSACGGGAPMMASSAPANAPALQNSVAPVAAYRLGSSDRLRIIVFGEESLSGDFTVGGEGKVALPLVGQVQAGGLTLNEFEQELVAALTDGYLLDPRVSVEVVNFRPFYITGEIDAGGEYPYVQGMTVLNAIAVAGGYTYRADRGRVFITHASSQGEVTYSVDQRVMVRPGDIIRIPERFF